MAACSPSVPSSMTALTEGNTDAPHVKTVWCCFGKRFDGLLARSFLLRDLTSVGSSLCHSALASLPFPDWLADRRLPLFGFPEE